MSTSPIKQIRIHLHRPPLDPHFGMATTVFEREDTTRFGFPWLGTRKSFIEHVLLTTCNRTPDIECTISNGFTVVICGKLNDNTYKEFEKAIINHATSNS